MLSLLKVRMLYKILASSLLIYASFFVKEIIPLTPDLPRASGFDLGEMEPSIQPMEIKVLPTKHLLLGRDVATTDASIRANAILVNSERVKEKYLTIPAQVLLY